jgi:hypothetical protein
MCGRQVAGVLLGTAYWVTRVWTWVGTRLKSATSLHWRRRFRLDIKHSTSQKDAISLGFWGNNSGVSNGGVAGGDPALSRTRASWRLGLELLEAQ